MIKIECLASGSSGNLYIVENENTKILLECGLDKKIIINKLLKYKYNIRSFQACLITHLHFDHSKTANYINQYIPIYANEGVFDKYALKGSIIEHKSIFKIGSINCMSLSVEHGNCLNNAFIFSDKDSTIFFGTDFSNMASKLTSFKFNEIWIECNYCEEILNEIKEKIENENDFALKYVRQITTHMSLNNCIYHLKNKFDLSNCSKIVLLHLSTECGDSALMKEKVESETSIKTYCALKNGGIE